VHQPQNYTPTRTAPTERPAYRTAPSSDTAPAVTPRAANRTRSPENSSMYHARPPGVNARESLNANDALGVAVVVLAAVPERQIQHEQLDRAEPVRRPPRRLLKELCADIVGSTVEFFEPLGAPSMSVNSSWRVTTGRNRKPTIGNCVSLFAGGTFVGRSSDCRPLAA